MQVVLFPQHSACDRVIKCAYISPPGDRQTGVTQSPTGKIFIGAGMGTHGCVHVKLRLSHTGVSKTEAMMANQKNSRWGTQIVCIQFALLTVASSSRQTSQVLQSNVDTHLFIFPAPCCYTTVDFSRQRSESPHLGPCVVRGLWRNPRHLPRGESPSLSDCLRFAERTSLLAKAPHRRYR